MLRSGSGGIDGRDLIADRAPFISQMCGGAADAHVAERHLNGTGSWFHVSISPAHDGSGSVPFCIIMLRHHREPTA